MLKRLRLRLATGAGRCLELRHRHNIFRVAATAQRLSPERREAGNGLDYVYESCKLLSRYCPIIQKRPMAKDHYVAQTYLKHWCDPKNKPPLQVYRKSDLKHFPCRPRDVCHEWDGDLIPEYLTHPARLGKFRKIFEPRWKPTVERLCAGNIDPKDKLVLSMGAFFSLPPGAEGNCQRYSCERSSCHGSKSLRRPPARSRDSQH